VVREIDADLCEYEIDHEATQATRTSIAQDREGWLDVDAESIAQKYRDRELNEMDLVRQYGVILDWGSGELLPKTTEQFRTMLRRRSFDFWRNGMPTGARA